MKRMVVAIIAILTGGLLAGPPSVVARDYVESFDGFKATWTVRVDQAQVRIADQKRNRYVFHDGEASELIELETLAPTSRAEFIHPIPACRILPELSLSLWVRASRNGAQLGTRVVFPYQKNPQTGRAQTVVLTSDASTRVGSWEHLLLKDLDRRLQRELPRLRAHLLQSASSPDDVDLRSPYLDRVILLVPCSAGPSEYFLDELRVGPIVEATAANDVRPASETRNAPTATPDAEFRLDRLYVRNKPFFPRMLRYHGEQLGDLSKSRFNLAWIPDLTDERLLADLLQHDLRAVATPPHPRGPEGQLLGQSEASLAPFGPETTPVLFWNLGTELTGQQADAIGIWADQVNNADRQYRRPLMVDVTGAENSYSRRMPMISFSRQPLHSPLTLKAFRDSLEARRHEAQPGSFFWTWIQTEPSAAIDRARAAGSAPLVVEPEQLRLQVYAALQAGCRGLGYWTETSLDVSAGAGLERKLMLAQLNMELELLEPWLATGRIISHDTFDARLPAATSTNQLSLNFATGSRARKKLFELLSERDIQLRRQGQIGRELDAAKIRTDYGLLLLPVWLSEGAQFVPDQMAANDATIVVPGVEETASAWEISTTSIRSLDLHKRRVAGGFQLTLPKFDLSAAILFTSDRTIIGLLQRKMETLRQPSALASLELAEAKLTRVTQVDAELRQLGAGQSDSSRILGRANALARQAREMYRRQDFDGCRQTSNDVMQVLRILQHACWHDALGDLYSPVSSPHAVCYQTLPDHWRLMNRFARVERSGEPILAAGDFESFEDVVQAGWSREQLPVEGVRSTAELVDRPHRGQSSLRLAAVPLTGDVAPAVISTPPITVRSPALPVRAGQILYVSGWVRVMAPTAGNLEGAQLSDNLAGPALALRWTQTTDWQQFGILREVRDDGEFRLTLRLSGYGDILFDDLQVTAHEAPVDAPVVPAAGTRDRSSPLQLLQNLPDRLPRFGARPPHTDTP